MSTTNATLACDLTVFTKEERDAHFAQAGRLRATLTGLAEVGDSTEFYFGPGTDVAALRNFAAQDRRCCGWIQELSVREETDRSVLVLRASREGMASWTNAFLGISSAPAGAQPSGPTWKQLTAMATVMCLACLLPLVGGLLVTKGLVAAAWNVPEGTYLALGAGVFTIYFARRWWKSRTTDGGKAHGCNC